MRRLHTVRAMQRASVVKHSCRPRATLRPAADAADDTHSTRTELTGTSRPSYTTRHWSRVSARLDCVAAAKLGRLVLSQHWHWNALSLMHCAVTDCRQTLGRRIDAASLLASASYCLCVMHPSTA